MMTTPFTLQPIGICKASAGDFALQLAPDYRPGLVGLDAFSHAIAVWWAPETEPTKGLDALTIRQPYTASPDDFGVFATRSEARPNPVGMSVFEIKTVDFAAGLVTTPYFDMLDGTPLLDLKPYFPASDRVARVTVPGHFSHWPENFERSALFDWVAEFRD
ncbi:MAG: TrmO family methyltransferase [Pseudomonadota bacterium]